MLLINWLVNRMLHILPTEINNIIWDQLSDEDVVQMGFVSKDHYLYFLDPIASKDLYYKNTSRSGLSKIKFNIKLAKIFGNTTNCEKHKYFFDSEVDVPTYEFTNINKLSFNKLGTLLKNYSKDLPYSNHTMHFVAEDLCVAIARPNRLGNDFLVLTLLLECIDTPIKLTINSRFLKLVLENRIYINRDLMIVDNKIIFQTAYLEYKNVSSNGEFKYINYTLQTGEKNGTLGHRTNHINFKKAFWYVTDTTTCHIIGISTVDQTSGNTVIDIYLINKALLDKSLTNAFLEIDLNNEQHYVTQIPFKKHPEHVYSTLNADESKVYILVANSKKFVIIIFDIFLRRFLSDRLYFKTKPGCSINPRVFRIIDNEYLLMTNTGSPINMYWIDIRRGSLKLDVVDKYSSDKIPGLCIYPDGILVKRKIQSSSVFNKTIAGYYFY